MAVIEGGLSAQLVEVGDKASLGMHIDQRPIAFTGGGHYVASGTTGTVAAGLAANSQVFHFRNVGNLAVVYDIRLEQFRSLGTAFAAGEFIFALTRITGWTVDGSGGSSITPLLMKTGMGGSSVTVRVASTGALGAGTSTLDASNMKDIKGIVGTAANQIQLAPFQTTGTAVLGYAPAVPLLDMTYPGAYPLVLAAQEGFAIRASVPGTGTWQGVFSVRWAEVNEF